MFDAGQLRLIAITDDLRDGVSGLTDRALRAVSGGATMIQLRLKNAEPQLLLEVARSLLRALPGRVPLVVNDRFDIALASGAAGVHLGADDLPVSAVRGVAPAGFIIGASVGSDDETANSAAADYVGIGPLFATGTKADAGNAIGPARFMELATECGKPAVAIGGITAHNVAELRDCGAAGVAVVSAVLGAADPEIAARELRSALAFAES